MPETRAIPLTLAVLAACAPGAQQAADSATSDPVAIAAVTAEVHTLSQATLSVDLTAPGEVAGACVSRTDPSEIHLMEGAGTTVALRFAGLLADTDYDCSVALTSVEGPPVTLGFRTPAPPPDISLATADATFAPDATLTGAYTVMNVKPECRSDNGRNYIAVLDPDGNNRWRYDLPHGMNIGIAVDLDGPDRFLWGGGRSPSGAPEVVDVRDGALWKLSFPESESTRFHHEARRIADGRILSLEQYDDPGWVVSRLRLSDDAGATEWVWDMLSAVDQGKLPPGDADTYDPHHVNWADVVDTSDGLTAVLSLCFSEQVMGVDVATGRVLWRLGKYASFDLRDADGNPLGPDDFPQCQHGLQFDGTHLLVYDNGFERGYTRVVEYHLDVQARVATQIWTWLDDGFFERYHGSVDWLTPDHQRVLVAQGNSGCDAEDRHSQIVEVDRSQDDKVVHRLVLREVTDWIYRAHRIDGCALFANAKYCPAIGARVEALRPRLGL